MEPFQSCSLNLEDSPVKLARRKTCLLVRVTPALTLQTLSELLETNLENMKVKVTNLRSQGKLELNW